jgi:asparagine synthetase A
VVDLKFDFGLTRSTFISTLTQSTSTNFSLYTCKEEIEVILKNILKGKNIVKKSFAKEKKINKQIIFLKSMTLRKS